MTTAIVPATDYAPIIDMVIRRCPAKTTQARYRRKLTAFAQYWDQRGRPPFSRPLVLEYVQSIADAAAFEICHSLTAIRALAKEARYAGLIDSATAEGILDISGPKVLGTRQGKRLTAAEVEDLLAQPDTDTLEGLRDRIALDLLFYAGLRREEACSITVEHIAMIDGRPAIVNLLGKGHTIRTVPIPLAMYERIGAWMTRAGIFEGFLLRRLKRLRHGHVVRTKDRFDGSSVYNIVRRHASAIGITLAPHDLRRTMGALARKAGAELDQIQAVYGHASVTMTQHYIGAVLDFQNAPCDLLPGATTSDN